MSDSVLLREERDAKKLALIRDGRAQRVAKMHAGNFGKGVDSSFIEKSTDFWSETLIFMATICMVASSYS